VAIDGVDGAGKTVFADELALILAAADRPIIRAGIDSFHNPRAVRYRRGATSPEGFFHDSYNYPVLKELLLEPLSPEGNGQFQRGAFDHRSDKPLDFPLETSATNAILLFDGIFLHNTELRNYWDFSIFLEVGFAISIPRGAQRGEGSPDPLAPSNRRYVEGQKLYLSHCRPHAIATVVVNNEDMDNPFFARGPARGH
jgi:uridine kinase